MMEWYLLYRQNHQPTTEEISSYIGCPLWQELNRFLQDTYGAQPKTGYSGCSMQQGWNVKYAKGGKSLCTLYPMEGYFIALVVIGDKEKHEAESLLPLCAQYTQELYRRTDESMGQRWLMLEVRDEAVLRDVEGLVQLRVKPKGKNNPATKQKPS